MISAEQAFVNDINQLRAIHAEATIAGLISAGGVLRRLLCEQNPLIHKANYGPKLKLTFLVPDDSVDDFVEMIRSHGLGDGLFYAVQNPGFLPPGKRGEAKRVSLDKFLNLPVEHVAGRSLNVRELIQYVANVAGGTHYGNPKKDSDKIFDPIAKSIGIMGAPAGLQTLASVIEIVIEGTEELYACLRE